MAYLTFRLSARSGSYDTYRDREGKIKACSSAPYTPRHIITHLCRPLHFCFSVRLEVRNNSTGEEKVLHLTPEQVMRPLVLALLLLLFCWCLATTGSLVYSFVA